MESKMAKKKQQIIPISYDVPQRQMWWTIIQWWSKPKICIEWTGASQKLSVIQWTYKSCISVSELDVSVTPVVVVSADWWNIITAWTDWWAFLDITWLELSLDTSLVYQEPNTTDWWLLYTNVDWVGSFIKLSHTETITPTANTAYTISHTLNSLRVQVVAYDVVTWEQVDVLVSNRTANTVDITSTTSDDLEIVIKK